LGQEGAAQPMQPSEALLLLFIGDCVLLQQIVYYSCGL